MATVIDGIPVALPPPPGYVVDFENPQRNSLTAAYWLFGAGNFLCLLFMLQRVYVRLVIHRRVFVEDACLFVAYVFSVVLQTLIIRDFWRGVMGTHGWEMPLSKFMLFLRALYLLPILYNPVQCGAKLSLLLLYRRLAPQAWFQRSIWFVSSVVIASSIAIMFTTIFPCRPIESAWSLVPENCIDRPAVYKATAILGAITDAMVFAVPVPVVLSLSITKRQKVGFICIFGIGFVTVITSIMRLVELIKSMGYVDQSWGGGPVLLWIFAESNMSCICGAMTTLKPFLSHISPRILGTYAEGSGKTPDVSDPDAPPTIGGSGGPPGLRKSNQYERFHDDPMYPLQTISNAETNNHERDDCTLEDGHGDGGSEKAIFQTRTMSVTYMKRK